MSRLLRSKKILQGCLAARRRFAKRNRPTIDGDRALAYREAIVYAAWLPFAKEVRVGKAKPPVAVIMGSQSDWATMRHAVETLAALKIGYDARIVSAHRTPDRLAAVRERGE